MRWTAELPPREVQTAETDYKDRLQRQATEIGYKDRLQRQTTETDCNGGLQTAEEADCRGLQSQATETAGYKELLTELNAIQKKE